MALNLDAVGRKIGFFTRSYDWRDLALYGLGEGRALWRVVRAFDGGIVIDNWTFEYGEPSRI